MSSRPVHSSGSLAGSFLNVAAESLLAAEALLLDAGAGMQPMKRVRLGLEKLWMSGEPAAERNQFRTWLPATTTPRRHQQAGRTHFEGAH